MDSFSVGFMDFKKVNMGAAIPYWFWIPIKKICQYDISYFVEFEISRLAADLRSGNKLIILNLINKVIYNMNLLLFLHTPI